MDDQDQIDPFGEVKKPLRQTPITPNERLIFQNLFDTQIERRKEYAKQIGLELDPEDSNKFRPLGSSGAYQGEIDPGGFRQYFRKGGLKELGQDIEDVGVDVVKGSVAGTMGTAGAGMGATLGPVGAVAGAGMGAGAGALAVEGVKNLIGDAVLDKSIPVDLKPIVAETLFTAGISGLGQGLKMGKKAFDLRQLEKKKEAIINALQKVGGNADRALIEKAAENPDMFTKEAVKGGSQKLNDLYKTTFGLSPDEFGAKVKTFDSIPKDSYFGKMIKPLHDAAQEEVAQLSTNPLAKVPVSAVEDQVDSLVGDLTSRGGLTKDEEGALNVLKEFRGQLGSYVSKNDLKDLNYGQAKRFLNVLQDKAFSEGPFGTQSENPIISKLAGQFRRSLDTVASNAGSNLPELNAQQHEILSSFRTASKQLTPDNIYNAYVGGNRGKLLDIKNFVNSMDEKFGTDLSQQFEGKAAEKYFENVYKSGIPKGSSNVNAFIAEEAAKGGIKGVGAGAGVGAMTGVGAGPGAVIGGGLGAMKAAEQAASMANPQAALQTLNKVATKIPEVAAQSSIINPATAANLIELQKVSGPGQEQEIDPFAP